jgi:hypothetical protein
VKTGALGGPVKRSYSRNSYSGCGVGVGRVNRKRSPRGVNTSSAAGSWGLLPDETPLSTTGEMKKVSPSSSQVRGGCPTGIENEIVEGALQVVPVKGMVLIFRVNTSTVSACAVRVGAKRTVAAARLSKEAYLKAVLPRLKTEASREYIVAIKQPFLALPIVTAHNVT